MVFDTVRRTIGWLLRAADRIELPLPLASWSHQETANNTPPVVAAWDGYCPLCASPTRFVAYDRWYRDHLVCASCGCVPRERAVKIALDRYAPNWRNMRIHESSPSPRGVSAVLARHCHSYVASQLFDGCGLGAVRDGIRCEDLQRQTFADGSFDIVVTQDVMEHVFAPDSAYREIARTLVPGGLHIHTTPIYADQPLSERRALIENGHIIHLAEPEYHGNPVGDGRSLVTYRYGKDLPKLIEQWSGCPTQVLSFNERNQGLVAEFLDVIVSRKPSR